MQSINTIYSITLSYTSDVEYVCVYTLSIGSISNTCIKWHNNVYIVMQVKMWKNAAHKV